MATEGATGLGTAAIEAAIDHWATHRHEAVVRDVEARAELAALRAAAQRAMALTEVAQIVVDCRDLRADEFREKWGVGSWGDYYERLTDLADAALADAGPGAAGVRDETTALAVIRAELATPLAEATEWHYSWREAVGDGQPRLTVTIGAMQRIADALDAPRAGGAGARDRDEWGADGGDAR